MTRETAAINVGPGHDRPERVRACLLTGEVIAAAVAHYASYRPRLDETSRRAIESAARPHPPSADSGPAGSPATADARETAGQTLWLALCQAPDDGTDVTELMRMGAGPGSGHCSSDRRGGRPVPGGRASARNAGTRTAGRTDGTATHRGSARQPMSDQERAAIRQAGADDARRSRAGHGFPERIEDPAAVAVLAALLRAARPPPQDERTRRTSTPAA